jgi:hypothetical protein
MKETVLITMVLLWVIPVNYSLAGQIEKDDRSLTIRVNSDWKLSKQETTDQTNKELTSLILKSIALKEISSVSNKMQDDINLLLQNPSVISNQEMKTRSRAYGNLYKQEIEVTIPSKLFDEARGNWIRIQQRIWWTQAGIVFGIPVIICITFILFILLDRWTHGDRRRTIMTCFLFTSMAIFTSAKVLWCSL